MLNFFAKSSYLLRHFRVDALEFLLHYPKRRVINGADGKQFIGETPDDSFVGEMLVAIPTFEERFAHTEEGGAVLLIVAPEGTIKEALRLLATDGCVYKVEFVLCVDVG